MHMSQKWQEKHNTVNNDNNNKTEFEGSDDTN